MAKTWKFWPSTFRTQQGISAVCPSHDVSDGIAIRGQACLAGRKLLESAEREPVRYPPARPRVTGDRR